MPCTHKFFGHLEHLEGEMGLLPNWNVRTLIIGTFNPEIAWHPTNAAEYYYGRTSNYFWDILPQFAGENPIPHANVDGQIDFLTRREVGVTDLLVRINDADITNPTHVSRIRTVLDSQLELFTDFTWNTNNIIHFLSVNPVDVVYFTKLGSPHVVNVEHDCFEAQMRIIEAFCNGAGINTYRLHTPSGQGLGAGTPRVNKLINRWFNENGGNMFPFLSEDFNVNNYPFQLA